MKRLTILGIIACVGLLVGSAAVIGGPTGPPGGLDVNVVNPPSNPVPVTGTVEAKSPCCYRFVGLSEGETTGDATGRAGMNAICQATFGPTARMCTSQELLSSPISSGLPLSWVSPSIINIIWGSTTEGGSPELRVVDASGFTWSLAGAGRGDCDGWYSEDGNGWAITGSQFTFLGCSNSGPVACCVP